MIGAFRGVTPLPHVAPGAVLTLPTGAPALLGFDPIGSGGICSSFQINTESFDQADTDVIGPDLSWAPSPSSAYCGYSAASGGNVWSQSLQAVTKSNVLTGLEDYVITSGDPTLVDLFPGGGGSRSFGWGIVTASALSSGAFLVVSADVATSDDTIDGQYAAIGNAFDPGTFTNLTSMVRAIVYRDSGAWLLDVVETTSNIAMCWGAGGSVLISAVPISTPPFNLRLKVDGFFVSVDIDGIGVASYDATGTPGWLTNVGLSTRGGLYGGANVQYPIHTFAPLDTSNALLVSVDNFVALGCA